MKPLTHCDLLDILTQAESRVKQYAGTEFDHVAKHAQQTVDLVMAKLAREGITRRDLEGRADIERLEMKFAGAAVSAV